MGSKKRCGGKHRRLGIRHYTVAVAGETNLYPGTVPVYSRKFYRDCRLNFALRVCSETRRC